jgi:hypothetical protein
LLPHNDGEEIGAALSVEGQIRCEPFLPPGCTPEVDHFRHPGIVARFSWFFRSRGVRPFSFTVAVSVFSQP